MWSEIFKAIADVFRSEPPKPLPAPVPVSPYVNRDSNRKAFLAMLRWSEGTAQIPNSDNGYRALVGGGTFEGYECHPHKLIWIARINKYSTAAGAYQILFDQWQPYIVPLGLKNFSPPYQDLWALNALREVNALDDIDVGRFASAVAKAGNRWASLPGSKFGQSIRTLAEVTDVYSLAGGQFAV